MSCVLCCLICIGMRDLLVGWRGLLEGSVARKVVGDGVVAERELLLVFNHLFVCFLLAGLGGMLC